LGNLLKLAQQQQIQSFLQLGWRDRRISREMGISRTTVARYRDEFQNRPEVPTDTGKDGGLFDTGGSTDIPESQSRPEVPADSEAPLPESKSKNIDPLRRIIGRKYTEGLSGQRIYQDLVEEESYQGSYDSVKRFCRKLQRLLPADRFERLPTYPGAEAQVDFGKGALVFFNGKHRWAWLFKMTLSYSGHAYEELVFQQDIETFLRCHEHAFAFFGGVPATIKLDNLKSGVLRACLYDPLLNILYRAFSEHWGFIPNPCPPRTPNQKGRVERDVGYTKNNALKGRKFASLEEGNTFLRGWNERWARTRIHGSKKRQVWKLFTESEQNALRALAEKHFPMFRIGKRTVSWYGQIEVGGNYYPLTEGIIGERVQIHFNREIIRVYRNQVLIKVMVPLPGKGHVAGSIIGDRPERPAFLDEKEGRMVGTAKTIGSNCHVLALEILAHEEDPIAFRRVMGIISLVKKYPKAVIDFACEWALKSGRNHYPEIAGACANIMASGAAEAPLAKLIQEHELIRQPSEYQTIIQERNG